ncbi:hypothetical protein DFH27DRAFT_613600 [Peziza echinospora]|nr:hypothetical protein DFH27DRAFT_613600 [Peziza echinospora]
MRRQFHRPPALWRGIGLAVCDALRRRGAESTSPLRLALAEPVGVSVGLPVLLPGAGAMAMGFGPYTVTTAPHTLHGSVPQHAGAPPAKARPLRSFGRPGACVRASADLGNTR